MTGLSLDVARADWTLMDAHSGLVQLTGVRWIGNMGPLVARVWSAADIVSLAVFMARFFVLIGLAVGAMGQVRTVHLRSGYSVTGSVLLEGERVIVDLGFTVLAIPDSEISRIESKDPTADPVAESSTFFRSEAGRELASVSDNVVRCQEMVVEVRTPIGFGSGFLIRPEGYIVTNDHVIAGEHKITVTLFKAIEGQLKRITYTDIQIVATNPFLDLALLKCESEEPLDLETVVLGNSDSVFNGETVFAIGSPLGLDRTVSTGIISLRNRPVGGQIYLQTTAQINPGNSGGPLFNLRGEVIGVANMKLSSIGVEGMAFAIPVDRLKDFIAHRDAFAYDARNPNAGFRYMEPPRPSVVSQQGD